MTQLLPPKKEVALALLERSNVDVYLDPRAKGVVVPPQFRKEPRLILKIGLNMPVPIPDLRLDDESMSCTLSFNRSPFFCVVPWPSVFAMVGEDGRGMVWPDDVPQELAVKVVDDKKAPSDREALPSPRARRGARDAKAEPRASREEEAREAGERPSRRDSKEATPREPSAQKEPAAQRKPKKKKDEGRPVLVAGPSSDRAAQAEGADRPIRRPPSSGNTDGVSAIPPSRGVGAPPPSQRRGDPNRPKRELPPYLRVVK
jgi:stringent starvation protein B